ncbi:hypothetical protein AMR42_15820 [Limnothrix sp. PR1529]|nr:hypothetical protein BCR12_10760 [Limnothrix sp. P13C2]PIB05436.1 hypothetical protein AMR42_15820 [Limnothrix sp. PR1529]
MHTDSWQPDLLQFSELVSKFNPSDRYLISYLEAGTTPLPRSVSGLGLKSIALIGDTHHLHRPISTLIDYLEGEAYDHIFFFGQPAHHCLFAWSGIKNLSGNWPKNIIHPSIQSNHPKRQSVSFFGNASSPYHPRRRKIFCALKAALAEKNIPFDVYPHMAEQEWVDRMSQSLITVVSSLNAQPTPQVFNAIASGTFCLVDRLSVGSNIYDYFEPGLHFDVYDSIDHLLKLINFYISHPIQTQKLSELGQIQAMRFFLPPSEQNDEISILAKATAQKKMQESSSNISKLFSGDCASCSFLDLVSIYEFIQEIHRLSETACVIIYANDASWVKLALAMITSLPRIELILYSSSIALADLYSLSINRSRISRVGNLQSPPMHVNSLGDVIDCEMKRVRKNEARSPTFLICPHKSLTTPDFKRLDEFMDTSSLSYFMLIEKFDSSFFKNKSHGEESMNFLSMSVSQVFNHLHNLDHQMWEKYTVLNEELQGNPLFNNEPKNCQLWVHKKFL